MNKLMDITEAETETDGDINYTSLLLVSLYYILFYTTSLSFSTRVCRSLYNSIPIVMNSEAVLRVPLLFDSKEQVLTLYEHNYI